jgi:hypothetical protein
MGDVDKNSSYAPLKTHPDLLKLRSTSPRSVLMPATDFNAGFFAKSTPTVDAERLTASLSTLYNRETPVYFLPTNQDDTLIQLNAFNASPEFNLLKTQYSQLIFSIDTWCQTHHIQRISPQTQGSAFRAHLHLLFESNNFYSIRSVLFYNDGKKALEILHLYLQDPQLSLEKKKDILRNLQASIIACADGTLTNILEAKNEFMSSQDAQSILVHAKTMVIQQLALAFHALYYEDYAPPPNYETHRINAYCDMVLEHYGLELRRDLTPPQMPERVLKAFPYYLDTHMRPALIIEQLITTIAPLVQQLHTEIKAIFSDGKEQVSSVDYHSYQKTYLEKIERSLARWNGKYSFLCPLHLNDLTVTDEAGLNVSPQVFSPMNLKARMTTSFKTNYLTEATQRTLIKIPNSLDYFIIMAFFG